MRPAGMEADSVGPSAPPGPSASHEEIKDEEEELVGPALPAGGDDDSAGEVEAGGTSASAAAGKKRWWEREHEAPKAAAEISTGPSAAAPQLKHDEWMTALPTDRVGFDPIEARQFTRMRVLGIPTRRSCHGASTPRPITSPPCLW